MTSKRKKRRRRSSRPRPTVRQKGRTAHALAPKTRLKPIFKTLDLVSATGDKAVLETKDADRDLVRFDINIFLRAINSVKSMRILLAQGHWEVAAAPVRQIFELVVNAEYVNAQPDREEAALRYMKFGLLQLVRGQQAALRYAAKTGRDVDEQRKLSLDAHVEKTYPEFRGPKKGWLPSWSGKSTKQLAELSPQPTRVDQYELLFTAWSEQVHASPGALLDTFFAQATEGWIEEAIASDDLHIAETASIGVVLFIDLWTTLPALRPIELDAARNWTETLMTESAKLGAPPLGR